METVGFAKEQKQAEQGQDPTPVKAHRNLTPLLKTWCHDNREFPPEEIKDEADGAFSGATGSGDEEHATSVGNAFPEGRNDWKPHEKSMAMAIWLRLWRRCPDGLR